MTSHDDEFGNDFDIGDVHLNISAEIRKKTNKNQCTKQFLSNSQRFSGAKGPTNNVLVKEFKQVIHDSVLNPCEFFLSAYHSTCCQK